MNIISTAVGAALTSFTRIITGAQARWLGCAPDDTQRIYYGNHSSHADFVLIWSSLPTELRQRTRPVAGADYWDHGTLRRYLAHQVINAVLIDRARRGGGEDPMEAMVRALDEGASLILFPEGTRNTTGASLLEFKSGLYHLSRLRPKVELVPVWLDNAGRVLPKGALIPIPLLCTVSFGAPLAPEAGEDKAGFLVHARQALLDVANQVRPE